MEKLRLLDVGWIVTVGSSVSMTLFDFHFVEILSPTPGGTVEVMSLSRYNLYLRFEEMQVVQYNLAS